MASKDRTKPTTPTGLTIVAYTASQIDLKWNAARDPTKRGQDVSGIRGYRVFRLGGMLKEVAGIDTTTYADTGLKPNTIYTYNVAAVDRAGNQSPLSGQVSVRTLAGSTEPPSELQPDITPPAVPTGLRVTQ